MWKPDVLKSRTLARRHVLILGVLFFLIQIICLVWLLYYLVRVQVDVNLNNKAYLFSSAYAVLSLLPPEERAAHADRLTNARVYFYLSDSQPEVEAGEVETDRLFRLRILYTLATQYKGIDFAYDNVPWDGYTSPEEKGFSWNSGTFDEFQENIPLIASVSHRHTPFRLLWGKRSPDKAESLDIAAVAALPFSDGRWLVANIHDNAYTAVDVTVFVISLLAQFLVLMLVVTLEIRYLVRPLKKLQQDAARINLDSPVEFHVPENSYEEIKGLATSIRELTVRLSEQIRQRSMTLTCLSHDLRSPVCRMRMQLERMEKDGIREVQVLNRSMDELQELMDFVLSYARSGRAGENAAKISLPSLLYSLSEDFEDGGHAVRTLRADPCGIVLYPQSMRRCLQNLIQNALDYAKNSDECFEYENCEVQLEGVEEEDHYVIFVRDFGEGMSEEDLVRVFEPFVRLEHSRNRKTGGTGLGLSIARNLARLNNADITLSNAHPGLLATVRISKAGCLAGSAK